MKVWTAVKVFFFIYPISLALTHSNYIGFGGNVSLRISILTASVMGVCLLFCYKNNRGFVQKEKFFLILGLLAVDWALKIASFFSVLYKSNGNEMSDFMIRSTILAQVANTLQIIFFVIFTNWLFTKFLSKIAQDTSVNKIPSIQSSESPQENALFNVIKNKKKEDPLVGVKIGSKEINQRLIGALKNENGVHIESLLAILGSLAGYSCHLAAKEESFKIEKNVNSFMEVEGADNNKYYFGDLPNKYLAEDNYSIWSLVAGKAQDLTEDELPDINEIFTHVTNTVGGKDFGIPRIIENHKPSDMPINYVSTVWNNIQPIIDKFCEHPSERPILLGLAIQEIITMGKDTLPPSLAVSIVMECAVPMSKIGSEWLNKNI